MTAPFVAFSEITCPEGAAGKLVGAFASRLGEVEHSQGFDHLEVWQNERDETRFVMVSWWATEADFRSYMQSNSHRRSHDRIVDGPDRPRAARFTRFRVVAR